MHENEARFRSSTCCSSRCSAALSWASVCASAFCTHRSSTCRRLYSDFTGTLHAPSQKTAQLLAPAAAYHEERSLLAAVCVRAREGLRTLRPGPGALDAVPYRVKNAGQCSRHRLQRPGSYQISTLGRLQLGNLQQKSRRSLGSGEKSAPERPVCGLL